MSILVVDRVVLRGVQNILLFGYNPGSVGGNGGGGGRCKYPGYSACVLNTTLWCSVQNHYEILTSVSFTFCSDQTSALQSCDLHKYKRQKFWVIGKNFRYQIYQWIWWYIFFKNTAAQFCQNNNESLFATASSIHITCSEWGCYCVNYCTAEILYRATNLNTKQ
jgi:hypothetical protein